MSFRFLQEIQLHCNLTGPPSSVRSVVDQISHEVHDGNLEAGQVESYCRYSTVSMGSPLGLQGQAAG